MSVVFEDRVSTYPNRYLVTPESGTAYYATLSRADEPIKEGTPLNAATMNELANGGVGVVRYVPQDLTESEKNQAKFNLGLYPLNGCRVVEGETVTLHIGRDIQHDQQIKFFYKYADGYHIHSTFDNSEVFVEAVPEKDGFAEDIYTVTARGEGEGVNFDKCYFRLIPLGSGGGGSSVTYEDGNGVEY